MRGPQEALKRFANGSQTASDWYLVAFRVRFGLYAASERFQGEKETIVKCGHQLALLIHKRFRATKCLDDRGWSVTAEEYMTLKEAVDATDWMQVQLERKAVERYTHKVHKEMIRHVN
jgi:hypothetical protein